MSQENQAPEMEFVLDYRDSGEIVQMRSGAGMQPLPGMHLLKLPALIQDFDDHYVEGGQLVPKGTAPSVNHRFDHTTKTWIDPRTLGDMRAQQWGRIKASRDAAEFGGFTWDGSVFDSDAISQQRIQGAAQLATLAQLSDSPYSIDWTLANNSVRTLSAADMIAVGTAMGAHISSCHEMGRQLRAQIDAADTREAIEAVSWPALP